jgi:hypothetical protein
LITHKGADQFGRRKRVMFDMDFFRARLGGVVKVRYIFLKHFE